MYDVSCWCNNLKKKGMIDEYELISQSNLIFTHQNRSAITGESSI